MMESLEMLHHVRDALLSKKANDLLVYDVRSLSPVTDYYVIASGTTGAQLKAMVNAVTKEIKDAGQPPPRCSGTPDDGWMVLDCFDVVIHIFLAEVREYYAIEELWEACPRIG